MNVGSKNVHHVSKKTCCLTIELKGLSKIQPIAVRNMTVIIVL